MSDNLKPPSGTRAIDLTQQRRTPGAANAAMQAEDLIK